MRPHALNHLDNTARGIQPDVIDFLSACCTSCICAYVCMQNNGTSNCSRYTPPATATPPAKLGRYCDVGQIPQAGCSSCDLAYQYPEGPPTACALDVGPHRLCILLSVTEAASCSCPHSKGLRAQFFLLVFGWLHHNLRPGQLSCIPCLLCVLLYSYRCMPSFPSALCMCPHPPFLCVPILNSFQS